MRQLCDGRERVRIRRLLEDIRRRQCLRRSSCGSVAVACREKTLRVTGIGRLFEHRHSVGGELSIELVLVLGIESQYELSLVTVDAGVAVSTRNPLRLAYLGIHSSSAAFLKRI